MDTFAQTNRSMKYENEVDITLFKLFEQKFSNDLDLLSQAKNIKLESYMKFLMTYFYKEHKI